MLKYFVLVGLILLCVTSAVASPFTTNIDPIIITTIVKGHGNIRIVLNKQRNFGVPSNGIFYQGYYTRRGQETLVAASYILGKYKVVFPGKATGMFETRRRQYSIIFNQNLKQIKSSSVPSSAFSDKSCATQHINHTAQKVFAKDVQREDLQLTISTTADLEWYALFGVSSNAEILSAINAAEALYYRQLRIRFKVISQTVLDGITETDPNLLLNQFTKDPRTATIANVKYLFTGKDLDSLTVGIAYIGTICYAPSSASGVVQYYGTLTSNIFAHELGHNFGAFHDTSDFGNIMYPVVQMGDSYFTANSLNQINSLINNSGQCIEKAPTIPDQIPAVLSLIKSGSYLSGVVYTKTYQPVQNVPVRITINKTKQIVQTDSSGRYRVKLYNKKGSLVKAVAQISSLRTQIQFKM